MGVGASGQEGPEEEKRLRGDPEGGGTISFTAQGQEESQG